MTPYKLVLSTVDGDIVLDGYRDEARAHRHGSLMVNAGEALEYKVLSLAPAVTISCLLCSEHGKPPAARAKGYCLDCETRVLAKDPEHVLAHGEVELMIAVVRGTPWPVDFPKELGWDACNGRR